MFAPLLTQATCTKACRNIFVERSLVGVRSLKARGRVTCVSCYEVPQL